MKRANGIKVNPGTEEGARIAENSAFTNFKRVLTNTLGWFGAAQNKGGKTSKQIKEADQFKLSLNQEYGSKVENKLVIY